MRINLLWPRILIKTLKIKMYRPIYACFVWVWNTVSYLWNNTDSKCLKTKCTRKYLVLRSEQFRISHEKIHNLSVLPSRPTVRAEKSRSLRWGGQVDKVKKGRNVYIILVGNFEIRWDDDLKTDGQNESNKTGWAGSLLLGTTLFSKALLSIQAVSARARSDPLCNVNSHQLPQKARHRYKNKSLFPFFSTNIFCSSCWKTQNRTVSNTENELVTYYWHS
jgi:hypothetical protein